MTTRRDIITSGLGLAAIIAAGKAPAALVRSMAAARQTAFGGGEDVDPDIVEWIDNVSLNRYGNLISKPGYSVTKDYVAVSRNSIDYASGTPGYQYDWCLIEYNANKQMLDYWRCSSHVEISGSARFVRFPIASNYKSLVWMKYSGTGVYVIKDGRYVR